MAHTIDLLLEQSGLSIEDFAERSGLPADRVSAIVQGRWLASPAERQKLAAALGLTVPEIDWGHFMCPRNVHYHRYGLASDFRNGHPGDGDRDPPP